MNQPDVQTSTSIVKKEEADTLDLPARTQHLEAKCFGLSDTGRRRPSNEDQFLVAVLDKALKVLQTSLPQPGTRHSSDQSYLFVVADGMGGEAAGEVASALALASVEEYTLDALKWFSHFQPRDDDEVGAEFREAINRAHQRVCDQSQQRPEQRGMATTLTLAHSVNDTLFVAHVGDSRAYLFREGTLYQLTRDHTLVDGLVRDGAIKPADAATHPWRHVVTSSVGGNSGQIRIDIHRLRLNAGDIVLLCSDGLTEMVSREGIGEVFRSEGNPGAGAGNSSIAPTTPAEKTILRWWSPGTTPPHPSHRLLSRSRRLTGEPRLPFQTVKRLSSGVLQAKLVDRRGKCMSGGEIYNGNDLLRRSLVDSPSASVPDRGDERRHPRYYFRTLATATIYPPVGDTAKEPYTCFVLTRDLSRSGVSILHPVPLFQSQRIDLAFPTGQKFRVEIKRIRSIEQNCFVLGCAICGS